MNRFGSSALVLFILFFLALPVYSNYTSYGKIDPILKKTWDEQIPLPYDSIKKKNINNKGILQYRLSNKRIVYIYTFLVYMSNYEPLEKQIVKAKGGREMLVKLYFDPLNKEKPYWIQFGELDEELDRNNFIKYVN
ncbi:hypothetical protein [Leptospira sp. GIMC2001]|uniref:hypothetical protein n=1 Tax=Leptospira sp. GIMC2001 TaxID=1513297 RepID=UPI00234AA285|nr:hypothetical protein [Leptospira sp. GIMC2001]WCL47699.1 hypothetical protein O4O04_00140 [Leptospira sp. GIMC2001]